MEHPWRWLSEAWSDMAGAPGVSFAYGAIFAGAGFVILFGLEAFDLAYLILPMGLGFALIGPALAVGLYETSRRLENGETVGMAEALGAFRRNTSQIALIGVFLLIAFIAWCRIAMLEFMLFFGSAPPSLDGLMGALLTSPQSAMFLIVGTITGAIFAAVVFAMCAVAVPMVIDRDVDAVTAMLTSLDAVRHNIRPMALWAFLIALFTFAGLSLFFVGLVITLPLVGHASWHAYRDLVHRDH
jgi:uncharacterized membrane protein